MKADGKPPKLRHFALVADDGILDTFHHDLSSVHGPPRL
jgi:hypothetical protein